MGEKTPEKETRVTPKGAVEIDEEKLDQAAGGLTDSALSLKFSKIEIDHDPSIKAGAVPQVS